MELDCILRQKATGLAHKKGILPKNETVHCPFSDSCEEIICKLMQSDLPERTTRTIYLLQNETTPPPTSNPEDRFYDRLEKTITLRRKGNR